MITLSNFAQATSQLASESGPENTPIADNAQATGVGNLAAFDEVLLQVWEPHQPISLRPSVVMDLIAQIDGNNAGQGAAVALSMDEQNQQLLDGLLHVQGQNPSVSSSQPMTVVPFLAPVVEEEHNLMAQSAQKVASKESSSLLGLLKSIGPRLDITPPVTAGETGLVARVVPEGLSAVIPQAVNTLAGGNVANSHQEIAAPRLESQLTLAKNQPEWQQQLRTALGERLQLQVESKVQHATIRLDPPDMGKIDISVHMEGGKLQVHINASQADVYRALQQSSAELRQTLTGQNSATVEVQVSANNSQQQQQKQQNKQSHADILAARHIETQAEMSADDGTLLTTV
ncbi:flagellar hook-length control protein FliK [Yersinia rohdei]|nr:flagellar hook-length control protein FliK [Yersinia rohdei]